MKKVRFLYAAALFFAALLLVALFVCTLKIGDLVKADDLGLGLGIFFTLLFTAVPFVCYIPVAALLLLFCILVLARGGRKGVAKASLIVLSIFLPILAFSVFLDLSLVWGTSTLFTAVLCALAAVYLLTFVLSIVYFVLVKRHLRGAVEA